MVSCIFFLNDNKCSDSPWILKGKKYVLEPHKYVLKFHGHVMVTQPKSNTLHMPHNACINGVFEVQ